MSRTQEPGRSRLLRLVIAFAFAQGAVSTARPAVSYRALSLGDRVAVQGLGDPRSTGRLRAVDLKSTGGRTFLP
ncbi:hypothetical protein C5746_09180 [Streptomyces atratus]|uniref:Uncharacterized protein n=1 Tax=Streptomyces atratus TaxID=1893 RepID=A0A2Z5J9Q0_STRAR|nr:hypothetical protein C5746_09180 [Streptomyces atratus]